MNFIKKILRLPIAVCFAVATAQHVYATDEVKPSYGAVEFISHHKWMVAGAVGVAAGVYLFKKYGFASRERMQKLQKDIDDLDLKMKKNNELADQALKVTQNINAIAIRHEISLQELCALLQAKGYQVGLAGVATLKNVTQEIIQKLNLYKSA